MGAEQSKGKTTSERVPEEPVEYVDPAVKEQKLKEVCKKNYVKSTLQKTLLKKLSNLV
jgi:hypothetical protein